MEFANWVLQQDGWLYDYRNPSHGPPEELNTAIALPVGISRPALSLFARLSDAIKRRDEAELDVLALRAVGALGYDSLSRTGREVWGPMGAGTLPRGSSRDPGLPSATGVATKILIVN